MDTNSQNASINKPASTESSSDRLLTAISDRLLGQSGIVSSSSTQLEEKLSSAISGIKTAGESSAKRIESTFDRDIAFAEGNAQADLTQFQEERRGFATNIAALRRLVETTDKNLNDLRTRKEEALLANDSRTAAALADLEVKSIEFKMKQEQEVFQNLLSSGNFALSAAQEARQNRQQSFAERSAIAGIALEYGVEVKEGDTIDTITARAKPFASQKQQLELEKTRAEIKRANAEAAKALQGNDSDALDATTISILAQAGQTNPSILGLIKNPKQAALVQKQIEELNKPRAYTADELRSGFASWVGTMTYAQAATELAKKQGTITNYEEAKKILDEMYQKQSTGKPFKAGIANVGAAVGQGVIDANAALWRFFSGFDPRSLNQ